MAIPSAFQKAYKLSTCLKASRLRRRRIFGVLLETRHSPRPLSLCLQSDRLRSAVLPLICARSPWQVLKFPLGTLRAATFTRFVLLRIPLGKLFVFQTFPHKKLVCLQSEQLIYGLFFFCFSKKTFRIFNFDIDFK